MQLNALDRLQEYMGKIDNIAIVNSVILCEF